MSRSYPRFPALVAVLLLAACSFTDDMLSASLSGEDPRGAATPAAGQSPGVSVASTTGTSSTASTTAAATAPAAVGSPAALRVDLQNLQNDLNTRNRDFADLRRQLNETLGRVDEQASDIENRLKSRNVPNDPRLLTDWSGAQTELNHSGQILSRLAGISSWATSDVALAGYVVQAVHAAGSQPNVSELDRRQFVQIEAEANRLSGQATQLVTQISGEIASRNLALVNANRRLAALSPRIAGATAPVAPATVSPLPASAARALVTIHFDRPDVAYEQQLYAALNEAIQRRPDLALDVVAVAPPGEGAAGSAAAKRNIESVVEALVKMGLPPSRMRLSSRTLLDADGNEVRIYPR
ncbi:MAG: hypothetical protein JWL84_6275 [Rhodospirillales bacterium]|nr:hypothetical protein [Rhodospirillales bacterium]